MPRVVSTSRIKEILSPGEVQNCLFFYDSLSGVTLDGSSLVSSWTDSSGGGATMTQSTPSLRFGYTASSINGKPTVDMVNGGGNKMTATISYPTAASAHTLISLAKSTSTQPAVYSGILSIGSGAAGGNTTIIGTDSSRKLWTGGAGYGFPVFNVPVTGTSYLIAKRSDKRTDVTNINGVLQQSYQQAASYNISPLNLAVLGQYTLGSSSGNWGMAFSAGYNRQITDKELEAVANFTNITYSLAVTAGLRSTNSSRTVSSGRSLIS